jgi:hypothetical protein
MRLTEVMGGLYVMISEEECDLMDEFFLDREYVTNTQLSERQVLIAESLVRKGVLLPTVRGFKIVQ